MKQNREGQARVLTREDEQSLWDAFLRRDQDRYAALFATCLYTGCRVSEALYLKWANIDIPQGVILFPKGITKGKRRSREVPIAPVLATRFMWLLGERSYEDLPPDGWVFPAKRNPGKPLARQAADHALRSACQSIGLTGVSTHSFRRTALTRMAVAGVPLPTIQAISGHRSLDTLQRYLEVSPSDKAKAITQV